MKKDQVEILQAKAIDLLNNSRIIKELIGLSMRNSFHSYDVKDSELIFNKMMAYYFQDKATIHLAILKDEVCGFIWFFQKNNHTIHVNHFSVLNHYQNYGIGSKLFASVEKQSTKTSLIELNVSCSNKQALNFYKNKNFVENRVVLTKKIL